MTLADDLDALGEALSPVAPWALGQHAIAEHGTPPRYVARVLGASTTGTTNPGASSPRSLAEDLWSVEVHCWGSDMREAEKLRAALLSACRKKLAVRAMFATTQAADESVTSNGFVFVVTLQLRVGIADMKLVPELIERTKIYAEATQVAPEPELA